MGIQVRLFPQVMPIAGKLQGFDRPALHGSDSGNGYAVWLKKMFLFTNQRKP